MMVSSPSSERSKKKKESIESIESSTRERMQIIADILNHCAVYRTKNYIMENAHLNLEQVNYCLCNLLYRGFVLVGVSSSQGSLIYKTTEKGRGLLEYYYHMMEEFLEYNNLMMGQIRQDYVEIEEEEVEQNIFYYNNTNHNV
jgi:predicted transcriptional regulator